MQNNWLKALLSPSNTCKNSCSVPTALIPETKASPEFLLWSQRPRLWYLSSHFCQNNPYEAGSFSMSCRWSDWGFRTCSQQIWSEPRYYNWMLLFSSPKLKESCTRCYFWKIDLFHGNNFLSYPPSHCSFIPCFETTLTCLGLAVTFYSRVINMWRFLGWNFKVLDLLQNPQDNLWKLNWL